MTAEKQTWRKPELVILVRHSPEENVLLGCKHPTAEGPPRAGSTKCSNVAECRASGKS
jgi:hypothetical protein